MVDMARTRRPLPFGRHVVEHRQRRIRFWPTRKSPDAGPSRGRLFRRRRRYVFSGGLLSVPPVLLLLPLPVLNSVVTLGKNALASGGCAAGKGS